MYWANECTSIEEVSGRHRAVIGIKPRAFLKDGSWRAMSFRLGNTGDPQLPFGLAELLTLRLANNLAGQSPTVHVGRGQNHIRMTAIGTNNASGSVVLDAIGLPIGRRYDGAWTGADLEYLSGGHYLRKNVYLKAGHPSVFEFRIDGLAGTLSPSSRGWDLLDDAGRPVLWAGAGFLHRPDSADGLTVPVPTSVRVQGGKSIYRYELPAGDWAGWVLEPTWTSQPGADDGQDTQIQIGFPDTNYGTATTFYVGYYAADDITRALLKFSLTGIPTTARVSSAVLSLYCDADTAANADRYAVFRQQRAWVESQATWNIYSTGNSWATAGGFGANDCEQTEIGGRDFSATETLNEFKSFVLTPQTVSGLDLGNGWLIKATTENAQAAYRFPSSDSATASQRPSLSAEYVLPATVLVPLWAIHSLGRR